MAHRKLFIPALVALGLLPACFQAFEASASSNNPSAISGRTNKNGGTGCGSGSCHGSLDATMTVTISGATALNAGEASTFTVTNSRPSVLNGTKMGAAIAASDSPTPLAIGASMPQTLDAGSGEVIHNANVGALRTTTSGSANYTFTYTMPAAAAPGSTHTLYAVSVLAFLGYQHATNFTVTTRPTATSAATASGATTTTMNLSWSGGGPEYRVVYKTGAVAPANETDGTNGYQGTGTSTTITGLTPSTQYTFRVFSKLSAQNIFATTGASATASTSALSSAPRYVNSATGSNASNNCLSVGSPCKTITYAMSQASAGNPGDTVSVAAGTYSLATGEVFPIVMKSGVTLISTGSPGTTVIDAAGDTVQGGILTSTGNASSATRIEGFTFKNGLATTTQGGSALGGGIRVSSASALLTITRNLFLQNEVRGYSADGSLGQTGGLGWGGAIYVFSSLVDIRNNVFIGNLARGGNGLDHPGTPYSGNEYGGPGEGGAIYFAGTGYITNNTFHLNRAIGGNGGVSSTTQGTGGNATAGAVSSPGNPGPNIDNNIFVRNSAEGGLGSTIGVASAGAMTINVGSASNNLFYNNQAFGTAGVADSTGTSPLTSDPQFHAAPLNLRLRTGSPATGQGIATGNAVDFDNNARPSPPAIGAFEPSSISLPAANLYVTQSPSTSTPATNKDLVYTLTVYNQGPNSASDVQVLDLLPAGSTYVWSGSNSIGTCTPMAGIVTCAVSGSIPPGGGYAFKVVVRPPVAGSQINRNYVTTGGAVDDAGQSFSGADNLSENVLTVTNSPVAAQALRYRLYSDVTKEHHYTTDLNEYNVLGANGNWTQEGTVGKVLNNPGFFNGVQAVPYYRLYNGSSRWHHWTTDANEYYYLVKNGWGGEGVDGYILPLTTTGATQLYRLNYPFLPGLHHWTIDANEYNTLIGSYGWIGEGGSGFVIQ